MRAWILLSALMSILAWGCGTKKCPGGCPAPSVVLDVTSASDAGTLSGVRVSIADRDLSCEPYNDTMTVCFWHSPIVGTYTLSINATGFQSANLSAEVTIDRDPQCGCPGAAISPSKVTLEPCPSSACDSDAGTCCGY